MNENPGCFKIDKGIAMPSCRDNRFNRTAGIMADGDSVLFPTLRDAQRLQYALRRLKKKGLIRKVTASHGEGDDKVSKLAWRVFCVEPMKR
jgi:hypothetical protein